MPKSMTKAPKQDQQEKLLSLIGDKKMSLVKAAQTVGLSYINAKKTLFIYGTPRRKALSLSRTPENRELNKDTRRISKSAQKEK